MESAKGKQSAPLRLAKALFGALLLSFAQLSGFTFGNSYLTQLLFGFLLPLGASYLVAGYFLDKANPLTQGKGEWWLYASGVALNSFSLQLLLLSSLTPPSDAHLYLGALLAITMGVLGNLCLYLLRDFLGKRWPWVFFVSATFPYGLGQVVASVALIAHVFLVTFLDRERQGS